MYRLPDPPSTIPRRPPVANHVTLQQRLNATRRNVKESLYDSHQSALRDFENLMRKEQELTRIADQAEDQMKRIRPDEYNEMNKIITELEAEFRQLRPALKEAEQRVKKAWDVYKRYDAQMQRSVAAKAWANERWQEYLRYTGRGGRGTRRLGRKSS
jgi:predicted  nucleic acid-binding Zn-ribbon protein